MTEAKNTTIMETEAGGENTPYESANTFTKPHAKSQGQFSDPNQNEAQQEAIQHERERGEQTAENIRDGEAISEHGFGGETVGNSGEADQGAGEAAGDADGGQLRSTRRAQGYAEGSGVGA